MPVAVIEMLLKAHPGAVRQPTKLGALPLHAALRLGATRAVINKLVEAYPESAVAQDARVRRQNNKGCVVAGVVCC